MIAAASCLAACGEFIASSRTQKVTLGEPLLSMVSVTSELSTPTPMRLTATLVPLPLLLMTHACSVPLTTPCPNKPADFSFSDLGSHLK